MNPLLRWTTLSAFLLTTVAGLIYWAAIVYAQSTVGPMMGRGPSVSEEVDRIAGALSLWGAFLVGLLALAATVAYWVIHVRGTDGGAENKGNSRVIKASLVLVPLALAVACMLVSYVVSVSVSNSYRRSGPLLLPLSVHLDPLGPALDVFLGHFHHGEGAGVGVAPLLHVDQVLLARD